MDLNSTLFDRIRIKPSVDDGTPADPPCDHPACGLRGPYRAPMGRNNEGRYFHFCLAHVQEYNKSYNYFSGMTDSAIAAFQKDSLTGHRPTQPMNVNAKVDPRAQNVADAAEILERIRRARAKPQPQKRTIGNAARKALDRLGLEETASAEEIRQRFTMLVKRLHPDANGGDRSTEDRMREVIEAYKYLKQAELV
jgi:curved DNA-binding protein CbpA